MFRSCHLVVTGNVTEVFFKTRIENTAQRLKI
jgi:acylphosphatase